MSPALSIALITLLAVLLMMGGELILSAFNEVRLRARGAVEPGGDVIAAMRWAYPGSFVAMAIEGALSGPAPPTILVGGLVLFGIAKAFKMWAIASLGPRWSYRVLVIPGEPLVQSGPYRFLSHPNYLAVVGEMAGVAATVWAPITGTLAIMLFGWLMTLRIRVEDRALGRLR
ncbi:MAG: isoprenylcysteine carboxylmethyltransferase family protein [Acidobacteriota bacterium]|nr:isoprenylcysteine carboxylmethyltransferase family protein [Acidobacteriota bacterium]